MEAPFTLNLGDILSPMFLFYQTGFRGQLGFKHFKGGKLEKLWYFLTFAECAIWAGEAAGAVI